MPGKYTRWLYLLSCATFLLAACGQDAPSNLEEAGDTITNPGGSKADDFLEYTSDNWVSALETLSNSYPAEYCECYADQENDGDKEHCYWLNFKETLTYSPCGRDALRKDELNNGAFGFCMIEALEMAFECISSCSAEKTFQEASCLADADAHYLHCFDFMPEDLEADVHDCLMEDGTDHPGLEPAPAPGTSSTGWVARVQQSIDAYNSHFCDCYTDSDFHGDRNICELMDFGTGIASNECQIEVLEKHATTAEAFGNCVAQSFEDALGCVASCPAIDSPDHVHCSETYSAQQATCLDLLPQEVEVEIDECMWGRF